MPQSNHMSSPYPIIAGACACEAAHLKATFLAKTLGRHCFRSPRVRDSHRALFYCLLHPISFSICHRAQHLRLGSTRSPVVRFKQVVCLLRPFTSTDFGSCRLRDCCGTREITLSAFFLKSALLTNTRIQTRRA
jgi:hypothetical protein